MKLNTWIILFFLPLLLSCSSNENEAVIEGKVNGIEKQEIVLSEIGVRKITPVDSVKTNLGGEFHIAHEAENEALYLLNFSENEQIVLVLSAGDEIHIDGNEKSLSSLRIEGSEESQAYLDYQQHTDKNRDFIDSVATIIRNNRNSIYAVNQSRQKALIDSVFQQQKEMAKSYVRNNPASLTSLIVLNQPFGRTPLFDAEDDFAFFAKIDSALMKRIPENKHSRDHHLRTESILQQKQEKELAEQRMQKGKVIPDISLPDTSGKNISLHSLRGSKVLVYFWSATNAKSRQINHELITLTLKHEKDLIVYAISLDQSKRIWKAAVKIDSLKWINVHEPAGFNAALIRLLNVPSKLPWFILLDEESRILAKNEKLLNIEALLK